LFLKPATHRAGKQHTLQARLLAVDMAFLDLHVCAAGWASRDHHAQIDDWHDLLVFI
jgi:hypothetical protein